MTKQVYALDGKEIRKIELNNDVFNVKVSEGSVYHAIKNELANLRVGTASTKTRSEVAGSGRKPWRQKGTGRARAGTRRSPIWVGGGITFGPKPRSYNYTIPKKIKQLAMKSILTQKVKEDRLKIIEDFEIKSGKTKDLIKILKYFIKNERTIIILKDDSVLTKRAGANIPWLRFLTFNRLRAHDLFYSKKLIVLETAIKKLNDFYINKR